MGRPWAATRTKIGRNPSDGGRYAFAIGIGVVRARFLTFRINRAIATGSIFDVSSLAQIALAVALLAAVVGTEGWEARSPERQRRSGDLLQ